MDETELQQRLTRLAERTAPPPRAGLTEVVVARHRRQRRQAVGVAALAAAVAAVVVAVPVLTGGTSDVPTAASAAGSAAVGDVLSGPARGSLAGDAGFLEGVRQLPWTSPDFSGGIPAAPVDTRRVIFAGDVAGARWALVTGEVLSPEEPGDVAIAWFAGPVGAAPDQMRLDSVPYGVDPDLPLARSDGSTGALVVLAAPGDTVEVSARPDVAADGSVSRVYEPVDAPDGVAVTALPSTTGTWAARYRVERAGAAVVQSTPDGVAGAQQTLADVPVDWLRGRPTPGDDPMVRSAIDGVLVETGLTAGDVTATGLWIGEVAGPHDRRARVVLLAVTLPSGAVYLTAPFEWTEADGSGISGSCGTSIEPAGVPLEQRALAVRCDVYDDGQAPGGGSSLVVLAPGSGTARVVDMTGVELADVPLVDGSTVVPAPERAAAVEVSGRDERLRLLSTADLGD